MSFRYAKGGYGDYSQGTVLVHEKAVLRVFPEIVAFFARYTDFAKRHWNRTQASYFVRPALEGGIDLFLNDLGLFRISFKK